MRWSMHVALVVVIAIGVPSYGGTRLFMSDTLPWRFDNSDEVFEIDTARVLVSNPDEPCATLELAVQAQLKGNSQPHAIVTAVYLNEGVLDSCVVSETCSALKRALVYLSHQASPICQNVGATVLDITVMTPGQPPPIDEATRYRNALDKTAWAENAIAAAPTDVVIARDALAATLNANPASLSVRNILRSVALNDALDEFVRNDALNVLETTNSPARTTIIRDLRTTKASPELKRRSLSALDSSLDSVALLREMTVYPEVGGRATALLAERGHEFKSLGVNPLLVDNPSQTAIAQLVNLSNSSLGEKEKQQAMTNAIDRLIPIERERFKIVLDDLSLSASSKTLIKHVQKILEDQP